MLNKKMIPSAALAFIVSALAFLIAALALAPATAFAETQLTANGPTASVRTITTGTFINPFYKYVIDTPITPDSTAQTPLSLNAESAQVFDDPYTEEVDNYLIECMRNRQRTITVCFRNYDENDESISEATLERALYHSGTANEGDYLRCQFGSAYHEVCIEYDGSTESSLMAITYTIDFFTTAEQEQMVDQKVAEIIDELSLRDLDEDKRVQAIYRYITSHVKYDYANLNDDSYTLKYSAYAALFNGTAVCQGYSALFYRIANECGIDARIINGFAGDGPEAHAWNIASIWGSYYNLDCTWDAGKLLGRYDYFLKCDAHFPEHYRAAEFTTEDFQNQHPMSDSDYFIAADFFNSKIYKSGYYSYKVSDQNSALITGYSGKEKNIVVPAYLGGYPVYAIGENVFGESCTAESITLSEGIQGWCAGGEHPTFYACPNLKTVSLPSTVGVPDGSEYDVLSCSDRFCFCEKLATIRIAAKNPYLAVVNNALFTKDLKVLLFYPAGATATSFTVPNGTIAIDTSAFAKQQYLTSVTLPNTLESIGYFAFECAYKLSYVNIPDSCTFIGQWAFYETSLKKIHIPASVETIVDPAFIIPTLESISVAADNPYYYVENGVMFSRDMRNGKEFRSLECYPAKRAGDSYAIPNGISRVACGAFSYATGLKAVTFPQGLLQIDYMGFYECTSLQSAVLPQGLIDIGSDAFFNCLSLKSLYVPNSVTTVGENLVANNETVMIFAAEDSAAQAIAKAEGYKFAPTGTAKPGEIPQKVTLPATAYTKTYGDKAFGLGAATSGDGDLKYSSSNTAVATVDSAGKVTIKGAGTATISVYAAASGICKKSATRTVSITVKKAANPLRIKAKTAAVKYSKVKAKAQKLKASKVIKTTKKGQGKMTYTKAKGNKKISIAKKTGKVTIKKGLAKGTYKVKVKVKAAGNKNYKASKVKTITFKIKVA